ncbi:hypothetical protein [Streptomyces sp. DT2A-34]|uniref:hypothetical protein n=1 Tax=Streptomyces sp. DT2A-34 TaxID=3051182 RepID=UPI0034649779
MNQYAAAQVKAMPLQPFPFHRRAGAAKMASSPLDGMLHPMQLIPFVHIDAHPIPANPAKGEPDHQHFDFRFLFRTSADVVELQTEEVSAAAWRHADTIENETLRSRVLAALR